MEQHQTENDQSVDLTDYTPPMRGLETCKFMAKTHEFKDESSTICRCGPRSLKVLSDFHDCVETSLSESMSVQKILRGHGVRVQTP